MIGQYDFTREQDMLEYREAIARLMRRLQWTLEAGNWPQAMDAAERLKRELQDLIEYES